jgi:hypothetical protein
VSTSNYVEMNFIFVFVVVVGEPDIGAGRDYRGNALVGDRNQVINPHRRRTCIEPFLGVHRHLPRHGLRSSCEHVPGRPTAFAMSRARAGESGRRHEASANDRQERKSRIPLGTSGVCAARVCKCEAIWHSSQRYITAQLSGQPATCGAAGEPTAGEPRQLPVRPPKRSAVPAPVAALQHGCPVLVKRGRVTLLD